VERIADREALFILGNGKDSAIAVCSGRWKLIYRYGEAQDRGHELYDLENDLGELNNVSEQHPEITKRLVALLDEAESAGQTRR